MIYPALRPFKIVTMYFSKRTACNSFLKGRLRKMRKYYYFEICRLAVISPLKVESYSLWSLVGEATVLKARRDSQTFHISRQVYR